MQLAAHTQGPFVSRPAIWAAALLIIVSLVMAWVRRDYPPRSLPAGMDLLVAMQLPHTAGDITTVLGVPKKEGSQKAVEIMRTLQRLDLWLYIPAYLVFFAGAGWSLCMREVWHLRWLGPFVIALAGAGAAFNYLLDFAILRALEAYSNRSLSDANAQEILQWSIAKWSLLYAAVLFLSPFTICRWDSQLLRSAGLFIAFLAAVSGASGITGAVFQSGVRVSSSFAGVIGLVLFFWPLYPLARHGLVAGLDALARFRIFSWLAAWTEYGKDPIVIYDLVPELHRVPIEKVRRNMADKISSRVTSESSETEEMKGEQQADETPLSFEELAQNGRAIERGAPKV